MFSVVHSKDRHFSTRGATCVFSTCCKCLDTIRSLYPRYAPPALFLDVPYHNDYRSTIYDSSSVPEHQSFSLTPLSAACAVWCVVSNPLLFSFGSSKLVDQIFNLSRLNTLIQYPKAPSRLRTIANNSLLSSPSLRHSSKKNHPSTLGRHGTDKTGTRNCTITPRTRHRT